MEVFSGKHSYHYHLLKLDPNYGSWSLFAILVALDHVKDSYLSNTDQENMAEDIKRPTVP